MARVDYDKQSAVYDRGRTLPHEAIGAWMVAARKHIGDDAERTHARLWLSFAAKQVVGTALRLLGVSAPESMERLDPDEPE